MADLSLSIHSLMSNEIRDEGVVALLDTIITMKNLRVL